MQHILYLVNQYPTTSHTFIRREIAAIENLGLRVSRVSIRGSNDELIDKNDIAEKFNTTVILEQRTRILMLCVITAIVQNPVLFLKALKLTIKLGTKSERGLIRHFAYLVEACFVKYFSARKQAKHVHAHFGTNSAVVAMLNTALGGPPFSFTVHGPEEFDKPISISLKEKAHYAKFVIAVSYYGKSQLLRWISTKDWDKINVIRCGLDPDNYILSSDTLPSDTDNILCIGRLCEQKGQLLLVSAVSELIKEGVKVELTLAGDGPMRTEIENTITNQNLSENIELLGWVDSARVTELILKSRFTVLPSFAEGLPVVIMESMALGRPVLSTYIAGIPELITPFENGWLIPAGSKNHIKKTIKHALDTDLKDIRSMGKKAHSQVFKFHNVNVEARKLIKLICS